MDGTSPPERVLDLVLEPHSDRFDPADDRWRAQVGDLYTGLEGEVGGLRREAERVPGAKGTVDTVILALGSAGAFTAAVEFLRAWLTRDRSRRLDVSWDVDGRTERVTVSGGAIDTQAIDRIAEAFAIRIGEKPWPDPDTAPS
ncbi:effector-associated constant component EACC1 [Geodermatophilus amargosae]|uniref:effector-associated constant component EACC1 n=1 Tax=Geodermatophilus amargosae TaxID=1296565 RepID=UPI0034E02ED8